MSAAAAASSSVAAVTDSNSSHSAVKRPRTGARSRGAYASRVCQRCRERKHKCVLDEAALDLPSSHVPIPEGLRCTRCRESGLDCVLYEDESAAKRRTVRQRGHNSAAAATPAQAISPAQSNSLCTGPTSMSHTLANYALEGSTSSVSASPAATGRAASLSTAPLAPTTPLASSTPTQQLALFHPGVSFTDKDRFKAFSHAVLYGARSIEMLSHLLVRTPGWCAAVGGEELSAPPASPCQLVDDALSQQLEPWVNAHVLWHPELPSLQLLRAKHLESPTTSTALLLSALYFITLPKLTPQPPGARETLSRLALGVRREALTVTMEASGSSHAVLALMLISQYAPSTMLSPLPAGEIRGTSAIVGRGLLATATHIAQLIKLHNAPLELRKLLEARQQLSPASAAGEVNDRALVEALDRVSLWFNLKRWCATLALEEEELNVPPELVNLDGVELLLFDADAHRGLQPCELDTMRTAGRMMLHSRLNMARLALMHAETFDFSDDLERVRPPVQRVSTATATVAKLGVEVKEEIDRVRLVLAPFVQNCPSVSVLLQWMQLEPLAWHSTILRISWIYVIWGCRASVWRDSRMGPNDIGARLRASEPLQQFSRDHGDVRSEHIEQLLLGFTDLACSSANAERRTQPGAANAVHAAVAAVPTLLLCSMVVSQAKAELDEKAATMATLRQLRPNTARQLSLLRFASHCLRDMDAGFKRGEVSAERGVRAGSLYIASAALCSAMAETIAEWKSHVDAHASSYDRERQGASMTSGPISEAGPSTSNADYAASFLTHNQSQGHAAHDPSASNAPYHLSAPTQDHPPHALHHEAHYPSTAQQQLDDQAFVDSLMSDPGQWNFLLADWPDTSDAAQAPAEPFDWASVFGLPGVGQ